MMFCCPSCGARGTVDMFLSDLEARQAVSHALESPASLAKLLLMYLRLFEPKSRSMQWSKFNRLLAELLPMLTGEFVARDGAQRACSHALWAQAFTVIQDVKHKLTLPLSTHGYLLEIAAGLADKADAQAEKEHEKQAIKGRKSDQLRAGVSPASEQSGEDEAFHSQQYQALLNDMSQLADAKRLK